MKKILLALALAASILLCGCSSEAEKANYNISKQADYFESERKITVYNARTDERTHLQRPHHLRRHHCPHRLPAAGLDQSGAVCTGQARAAH